MKTITKISLLIFIGYFFTEGCAEKMPGNDRLILTINAAKSYAWINLMPGGKPSFHFSSEIKIQNDSDEPVANLNLQQITMYDDTVEVLQFKPVFINRKGGSDNIILPNGIKDYSITSPDKINIDRLNNLKVINLILKFSSEGKTFNYRIESVKIERVY